MKVGFFIPAYKNPDFQLALQMVNEAASMMRLGYDFTVWAEAKSNIAAVRNRALKRAIDGGLDYLLMQDSDIYSLSKIGVVAPMLQTAQKNNATAVAAICGLRRKPHCANVEPAKPGAVYQAEKAGTGIILIDVNQVRSWGLPGRWFMNTFSEDGCGLEVGEDIHFSYLIKEHGGSLWVDGRVPTTHVREDRETLDYPGTLTSCGKATEEGTARLAG